MLGLVIGPRLEEESFSIGKVNLSMKFTATSKEFFVLLAITSSDVTYYNSASAYKTKTSIKMGTLPLVSTNHWA